MPTPDAALPPPPTAAVTAVVLCGGTGRRFGGDKTRADLGGTSVLDRLLDAVPAGWTVLCVGAQRPTTRTVTWLREDPPGGGPVAALAAALPQVETPVLVALGGDMPYAAAAAPALVARLVAATDHADGGAVEVVAARDAGGRVQPLLAAYRVDALRAAVPEPAAGAPLMRLLDRLRVDAVEVADPAALDVDTPGDLERARHRLEP